MDLKVYTDNNTAYTDLMAGNLDLVDDVPAAQLKNVKSDLGDRYINTPAGIIQTLAFPFYDKEVEQEPAWRRSAQGLSMAINREQITETIFQKTRTPATDWTSPVLGKEGGFQDGLCGDACEYDPDEAKKLIEEGGGLPGGQVKITYNADTGSHKEWVDAVCNSINNALGNDKACVGNPVGTFADFRNQITEQKMTRPVPGRLADGLPADPELPAAALLHQRLLQRRQVVQQGLRQARQRGQRRDRHRQGGRASSRTPRRSSATTWPPSRSGTRTAAPATPTGSPTWR